MANNLTFKPRLQVLTEEQILELHNATARVLEKTGIKVTHPEGLEIFSGAGARIDKNRVYIPRHILEKALTTAPSKIRFGNRSGIETIVLDNASSYFGTTLDDVYFFDPVTAARRQLTLDDCRTIVTISDALPNFTWGMTFGAISDVPVNIADRCAARQALTFSEKPLIFSAASAASLKDIYEMARIVRQNERCFEQLPPAGCFVTTISPLFIPDHVMEQMSFCARHNVPQVSYAGVQAGSTGPMSLPGTIVQGNAETLACLVFNQLVSPGSPVIYGHLSTIMDMRSTIFSFAAPEMNLMITAQSQIAQHYNIPFYGTAGCSDSKLPDGQAAADAVFSCFCSVLGCSGLIHDAGLLEYGTMVSPEQMVLVNEILHMIGQYASGLSISEESLALDLIDKIGPGGHYLLEDHTMNHFQDVWYSTLFDRNGYNNWTELGSKDLSARVRERTIELLSHEPVPLDEEIVRELDQMSRHWL